MYVFLFLLALLTACRGRTEEQYSPTTGQEEMAGRGMILIASDIVTEVIIRPDPEGDPWEIEKVQGYKGEVMINTIFDRIYDGSLKVYNYHTGEEMTASDVKRLEKEFDNDRSKIGKLSFTEDWYYNPVTNGMQRVTKSVVLGIQLYNDLGKVYAYKAAFQASMGDLPSVPSDHHPE